MSRMRILHWAALLACAFGSAKAESANDRLRIVIVGDSTVSRYKAEEPTKGWGQFLSEHLKSTVTVIDAARVGRSTKSFLKEGLWENALKNKPDIVLIQFGHNDQKAKSHPRATNSATDYKENLRYYIKTTREANAVPILVTPMHRRLFKEDGSLSEELLPYANAMKEVGAEQKVPVIDLYAMSADLYLKYGKEKCLEFASAPNDPTHFSEAGAKAMLELVMTKLPEAEPRLKPHLKAP